MCMGFFEKKIAIRTVRVRNLAGQCHGDITLSGVRLAIRRNRQFNFVKPGKTKGSAAVGLLLSFVGPDGKDTQIFKLSTRGSSRDLGHVVKCIPDSIRCCDGLAIRRVLVVAKGFRRVRGVGRVVTCCIRHFTLRPGGGVGSLSLNGQGGITVIGDLVFGPRLLVLSRPAGKLSPLVRRHLFRRLGCRGGRNTAIFVSARGLPRIRTFYAQATFVHRNGVVSIRSVTSNCRPKGIIALANSTVMAGSFRSGKCHILSGASQIISLLCGSGIGRVLTSVTPLSLRSVRVHGRGLRRGFVALCNKNKSRR